MDSDRGAGAGVYVVTVVVTDDGSPAGGDSQPITITVGEVNQAPVLGAVGAQAGDEGTGTGTLTCLET